MRKVSTLVGLTLLALAGSARAQEAAAPAGDIAPPPAGDAAGAPAAEAAPAPAAAVAGAYPDEYALRPLTLAAGTFQATVPVVLNLSKNAVLKPVWVPLDLRYGVSDVLEVFVSHNNHGTPLAFGGGGVCLGGKDRGCIKSNGDSAFYNNLNIGAQYSLTKSGGIELSGIGALEIREISPDLLAAIDVGVGFKYVGAPVSIKAAPMIGIGVTKRSADGNKEFISVPVQLAFQASPQLAAFIDTGIFGPTSNFGKLYALPLGIGASFLVSHGLDVGAEFMLPALVGGSDYASDQKGANNRTLMVLAAYRTN
jgi:hypothetical protein